MARMWPRRIPQEVRDNPLRNAECQVYDELARVLDDQWTVFYSRPWLGLSPLGEEIDGEADFILAHPELGFISIEVKGGEIRYEPESEQWTSRDRHRVVHRIKNPIEQAKKSKYRILELLQASPHWTPRWICIRHGVIFPDTSIGGGGYGAGYPRQLFVDREQLSGAMPQWLASRFGAEQGEPGPSGQGLGPDGIRALTKLLAEPFHLRVPIGHLLSDDDRQIEVLTQRQFVILSAIGYMPRVAIRGAAGTGKTVLAVELARRHAEQGRRTLLTCYNRPLAMRLSELMGTDVEVRNFHSLCGAMAQRAGLQAPTGISEKQLNEEVLPDLLVSATEKLPEIRFDSIIVDEGQDFRLEWWVGIDKLLAPGGKLVVFYDSNQRVYKSTSTLPTDLEAVLVPLNKNLRNTDPIHVLAMCHYAGEATETSGIEGLPVDGIVTADPDMARRKIIELVTRLTTTEKIGAGDIAILAATEAQLRALVPTSVLGKIPVGNCERADPNAIAVDTIRRFKGLDSKVIILFANPELAYEPELAYVAISRARTLLIALGDEKTLRALGMIVASPVA